ncbi:MAG: hypothetical protein AAF791_06245 [Bacteroidota bacterium]
MPTLPGPLTSRVVLFACALVLLILPGCDLLSTEEESEGFEGLSWASTDDASTPYVAVHRDGELLGVSADPATGEVTGAALYGPDDEQIVVSSNGDGIPRRMVLDGYVFEFRNVRADLADVVMITPDGDLHVARDVEFETPFGTSLPVPRGEATTSKTDIAGAANAAGLAIGIASCTVTVALSVGGAFATLGVAAPTLGAVAFGCVSSVVGVLATAQSRREEEGPVLQGTNEAFNQISARVNVVQCAGRDPVACIQLALQAIQAAFSDGRVTEAQRDELIRQAEAILENGGGDVQVSLTWDTTADIDLWVTDPSGELIAYFNRTSESGGQLDVDDRDGFGPENIFWPTGGAPQGTYTVDVDHFSGASPTGYSVTTVVQGQTQTFRGLIAFDQTARITTFTIGATTPVAPQPSPASVPTSKPAISR